MVMQMVHFWCPIRLRSWHERIYTKTGKYQGYHKDIKRKYRVKNNEELDGAIYEMLQLLGKCSGADRVYIFDKKEKNRKEYFCLQYEWKNEDDILEKEQLIKFSMCAPLRRLQQKTQVFPLDVKAASRNRGYLTLWFPEGKNAEQLKKLQAIIADEGRLRQVFNRIFEEEKQ